MEQEERARNMGWVPKEEFRGDESRWVDAETFLKRGDEMLPILKERFNKMETVLSEVKSQNARLEQIQKNLIKIQKTTSDRAYKKAIRELRNEQRAAVANGDTATFDRIESEINETEKERNEVAPKDDNPNIHPDYDPWVRENSWYVTDQQLSEYADFVGNKYAQQGLEGSALYAKVTEETKKMFPEKFENKKRATPPPVEGGGNSGSGEGGKKKGKDYRDLPAEAKAACDKYVSEGLYKTREEYVAVYFEGEE